jgi:internalin A
MMKIIVAQKQMNLSRLIVIALSAIGLALSGNGVSAYAADTQPGNITFADWCREKADLSPEAKHTVEVLLRQAETT